MREFKLKISPRMLELLSQNLYTNIYFVLAELIANAYDADADNVYIFIDDKEIRVEDDGNGMSEEVLDIDYLVIGSESRTNENNARSPIKKRLKMGRKGVGKLSALSISDGFKLVTIKDGKEIGIFIPKKIQKDDEILKILDQNEYTLKRIHNKGTAVIMENPIVAIPKLKNTIIKHLSKIFPNDIKDFTIHLNFQGDEDIVVPTEKDVCDRLATLIVIGNQKKDLLTDLKDDEKIQKKELDEYSQSITMLDNQSKEVEKKLKIYGWIGTYQTTRGMKKELNEFSDNYLAIYAHNKMGQRNVLDIVGKNRIYESYIVGNLYIDAFEDPDLPDMAGTNRQGYNENDPRWIAALNYIRTLTDEIIKMHMEYVQFSQKEKDLQKEKQKEEDEKSLLKKLEDATRQITDDISSKVQDANPKNYKYIIGRAVEKIKPVLGFKAAIDATKKKIMISQTFADKLISDVIFQMLRFNNVPSEDIIYSNCDDPKANLPERKIYDFLRKFFVESASTQMIYVLFVTSKNVVNIDPSKPALSWGVIMEIGAAWITRRDHWIFNINDFKPEPPLNIEDKWVAIRTDEGIISLNSSNINSFCNKIISTCQECGYTAKSFDENRNYLVKNFITEYKSKIS